MPSSQIDSILASNTTWPIAKVTQDQFFGLLSTMKDRNMLISIFHVLVLDSIMASFGLVWTVLLIGSLWKIAIAEKNNFYISMLIIAFLDLLI